MIIKKNNKRGASLSGFTEAGIGVMLILIILSVVVIGFNLNYNKTYDPTFGITTNDTRTAFEDYQATIQTGTEGEASTNAISGVNVVSSYGMIRQGLRIMFDFMTGGFIENAIGIMGLGQAGTYLSWALRLLFIFAVGFILIKIIFKIKP